MAVETKRSGPTRVSLCVCVCAHTCGCAHQGLRKIIAIDFRRRNVEMLPDGTFSWEWLQMRQVILEKKKRPGQRDAANARQKHQTLSRPSLRMKPQFTAEFWGILNHVHGDFISHTGFKMSQLTGMHHLKKRIFTHLMGRLYALHLILMCTWTSATTCNQWCIWCSDGDWV